MIDVAIIGAGVVGTLIARELSRFRGEVVLLDRSNDVANGSTKANSGIIHAGYDAEPGTSKAKFNVLGNPLFDVLCDQLDVRFHRIGSLVVAFSDSERETVEQLYHRGIRNGVGDLRIIEREELFSLEPNLDDAALCALYAPRAGIIDPWEIAVAAAENAADNGVEVLLNFPVEDIQHNRGGNGIFWIISRNGQIRARRVINCAGVFADRIHEMVAPPAFSITTRKGQYFVLDKTAGQLVKALEFLQEAVRKNQTVLFVGTKQQCRRLFKEIHEESGQPVVTDKWIPGLLTNYKTIKERIDYFKDLKDADSKGELSKYTKKEQLKLRKKIQKLSTALSGVEEMRELPDVVFVADVVRDHIAVKEARRLKIPVVAITDSNADPDLVDYVIPANDDAMKSLSYILGLAKEAVTAQKK